MSADKAVQALNDENIEWPDVESMAHSALQEAFSYGLSYDVIHRHMLSVMFKTAGAMRAALAEIDSKPATEPALEWTGNPDADLALILLDRLDDSGEDNACRIEQLEGLVRALAAKQATQPARAPLTEEQIDGAFAVVKWEKAPSSVWFEAGVRFAERAHFGIGEAGNG